VCVLDGVFFVHVCEREITNPSQAKGHQLVHTRDVHV
jgi:hypothetical protein